MKINNVYDLAYKWHDGQFRKDGKTPYIKHPLSICFWLYDLNFTKRPLIHALYSYDNNDELDSLDFTYYSVALMHDLLEDTNVSHEEIKNVSSEYIYRCVLKLTSREDKDNPFFKMNYLKEIVDSQDDLILEIKCIDRLVNVNDFINTGDIKYAKIYFHKADILWNAVYQKRSKKYEKLWDKIIKLNNELKGKKIYE